MSIRHIILQLPNVSMSHNSMRPELTSHLQVDVILANCSAFDNWTVSNLDDRRVALWPRDNRTDLVACKRSKDYGTQHEVQCVDDTWTTISLRNDT